MLIKFVQFFVWIFGRLIWLLFFRMEVKNRHYFKQYPLKGAVFVANHISYFDAFLISTNMPFWYYLKSPGMRFLATHRHAKERWYSPFIRLMGAYPLPKEKKGYEASLVKTIEYVNQGYLVVMFPTARCSAEERPEDARPGISYLVNKTKSTIAPARIINAYRVTLKELLTRRRRVQIIYGPPISYQEVKSLNGDFREQSSRIMEKIFKFE